MIFVSSAAFGRNGVDFLYWITDNHIQEWKLMQMDLL